MNMVLSLRGDWTIRKDTAHVADLPLDRDHVIALRFDSRNLGRWDSALLVFLSTLREITKRRGIVFDQTGLPPAGCCRCFRQNRPCSASLRADWE
jgi:hypothetical protein